MIKKAVKDAAMIFEQELRDHTPGIVFVDKVIKKDVAQGFYKQVAVSADGEIEIYTWVDHFIAHPKPIAWFGIWSSKRISTQLHLNMPTSIQITRKIGASEPWEYPSGRKYQVPRKRLQLKEVRNPIEETYNKDGDYLGLYAPPGDLKIKNMRMAARDAATLIFRLLKSYPGGLNADASGSAEYDKMLEKYKDQPSVRKQIINARIGQIGFRRQLMKRWDRRCAVTGVDINEMLKASHIKPWRGSTDRERRDPRNGLLLRADLDALFDNWLISFEDDGTLLSSDRLSKNQKATLKLEGRLQKTLTQKEKDYMKLHRELFKK